MSPIDRAKVFFDFPNAVLKQALFWLTLISSLPCAANVSREGLWWNDMLVRGTLQTDASGHVYALRVDMINQSSSDTALISYYTPSFYAFALSIYGTGEYEGKRLHIEPVPSVLNDGAETATMSQAKRKRPAIEIKPGSRYTFCVKIEEYLLPTATIDETKTYFLGISIGRILAWKRKSGLVTGHGYEDEATYPPLKYFRAPSFSFGNQKLRVHKGRNCN